ncbi:DedA family protein [Arthrobacter sp. MYb211]|uniref:DedA family protein n=1 Tax=Micrococcaceae TaxID=1268 RepID=UPI000BB72866|nr:MULTISPECIES: DedA family protein [Micrococcaceae]PCC28108.1 alkaline phosphatase [Glutamicibacter sp. BW80]PQZ98582.1 DedA family protein [Arthrobacter sp. MYb229]PRA09998.1 DedA family protein [Arthrobacter sp. MYb221]PRB47176.1 DedA family protein [Arthrobacter sp. MYb216]PRC05078.1 DedA family protein [Arthrobacter sp. MYb211]
MELVNEAITQAASAWWVLPLLFLFCMIDAFFPIVPSESFLVSLAAVGVNTGSPNLVLIAVLGISGAIVGDQITFLIGRKLGARGFAWMRGKRAQRVLNFSARKLQTSGALLIFTARYIPVGRVAVNLTAGATGFSHRRFTLFDIIGCVTWGAYSVGIGALAGNWLAHNKLLGIIVSVVLAVLLGYLIDLLVNRVFARYKRRTQNGAPAETSGALELVPPEREQG